MLLLRQAVSHARLSVTKSQRALNVVGARAGRPYSTASNFRPSPRRTLLASSVVLLATFGTGWLAYEYHQPTRYAMLSVVRCSRVAGAFLGYVMKFALLTRPHNVRGRCLLRN